ncbi:hypothetical protein COO60DRAFT_1498895 [Scenedesmus sp. NREL 46B-D3]|nr:hypothetical protein COO60DRAFT_1498895 [Scenedesmus sp. NREL 46B-D3]
MPLPARGAIPLPPMPLPTICGRAPGRATTRTSGWLLSRCCCLPAPGLATPPLALSCTPFFCWPAASFTTPLAPAPLCCAPDLPACCAPGLPACCFFCAPGLPAACLPAAGLVRPDFLIRSSNDISSLFAIADSAKDLNSKMCCSTMDSFVVSRQT